MPEFDRLSTPGKLRLPKTVQPEKPVHYRANRTVGVAKLQSAICPSTELSTFRCATVTFVLFLKLARLYRCNIGPAGAGLATHIRTRIPGRGCCRYLVYFGPFADEGRHIQIVGLDVGLDGLGHGSQAGLLARRHLFARRE